MPDSAARASRLAHRCLASIHGHVESAVDGPLEADGDVLRVPSLSIELRAMEIRLGEAGSARSLAAVIDARAPGEESGIQVLCTGFGDSPEAAAVDAGHQWVRGVFPALAGYLTGRPWPEEETVPLVVGVEDSGQRFAWRAHLGPVMQRVQGPPGTTDPDPGEPGATAAFEPVFRALHGYAAHTSLLWIESCALRYPQGRCDATCRLNNHDIPEAREALLEWAATWPDPGGSIVSRRQFVVLQPMPVEALAEESGVVTELEREMRRRRGPWWKRILGGR